VQPELGDLPARRPILLFCSFWSLPNVGDCERLDRGR